MGLDEHLGFEMMKFARKSGRYDEAQLKKEMIALLQDRTKLAAPLSELLGESEEEAANRAAAVDEEITAAAAGIEEKILCFLAEDSTPIDKLQPGLTRGDYDQLHDWCLLCYKAGKYREAIQGLSLCLELLKKVILPDMEREGVRQMPPKECKYSLLSIKWGLLNCYLADGNSWDQAATTAMHIEEYLKYCTNNSGNNGLSNGMPGFSPQVVPSMNSPLDVAHHYQPLLDESAILLSRTFLMHAVVYLLLRAPGSVKYSDQLLDNFIAGEGYLAMLSLNSPHLLRYVGALVLREKRLAPWRKDLLHVIAQERGSDIMGEDSLAEFLLCLHTDLNFEQAKLRLLELRAEDGMLSETAGDFFLHSHKERLINEACLAIFQTYCSTHNSVDIATIGSKMGLNAVECEKFIVQLMLDGKLSGACIDGNRVGFTRSDETSAADVCETVLEKTKNMGFRLALLEAAGSLGKGKSPSKLASVTSNLYRHLC